MIEYTAIARVNDGLLLAASMPASSATSASGHHTQNELNALKEQARMILKKLSHDSPLKLSIESGSNVFSYIIEDGIVYLALTDNRYPRRLVFAYLQDIREAFVDFVKQQHATSQPAASAGTGDWRQLIDTVGRPYHFIRFDRQMQKIRRDYDDPESRAASSRVTEGLNEVQNIMRKNIEDVLDRGVKLENVSNISSRLRDESKKYYGGAKKLNTMAMLRKYLPYVIGVLIIMFVIYFRFM